MVSSISHSSPDAGNEPEQKAPGTLSSRFPNSSRSGQPATEVAYAVVVLTTVILLLATVA